MRGSIFWTLSRGLKRDFWDEAISEMREERRIEDRLTLLRLGAWEGKSQGFASPLVKGLGFRSGLGFRVQGSGFRV